MNNILVSLKRIDKRIVAAVAAGIALLLVLNFLWVSPAQSNLVDQQGKLTASREELARDQARLADLQSGGTSSIEDLLRKVALMERALPLEVDDLALSKKSAQAAVESGMVMQSFQPVGEFTEISNEVGTRTYSFTVTGTVSQMAAWIDTLERDPTNLILFTQLTVATDSAAGSTAEGDSEPGLFTSPVTASGQVIVFYGLTDPLLVVPEPEESAAPVDPAAPVSPAPAPADPAAPVSPAPAP